MKQYFVVAVCILLIHHIAYKQCLPIAMEAAPWFEKPNNLQILLLYTLYMAVPAAYIWLLCFYMFMNNFLTLMAELSQFADRSFS